MHWAFSTLRQHYRAWLLLICVLGVAIWAVHHYSQPGQMSVIEAQAMDMSAMKPPVSAAPVAIEKLTRAPFQVSTSYTATVAPLTDQDIYPRVSGWLTHLDVYSGDRVSAGQVLAVLDAPDIVNQTAEAQYAAAVAEQEVPVSVANARRARSESLAAQKKVLQAQAELVASQANLSASQRRLAQAKHDRSGTSAGLDYQAAELKRDRALLKKGAISQSEFDQQESLYQQSHAQTQSADERIAEAQAAVEAAQAQITAQQAAVGATRSELAATRDAAGASTKEIAVKQAGARMSRSSAAVAEAFNKFRTIKAPMGGVVTLRISQPGTLVSPGSPILNIAQIDSVRLQATLAQDDARRIHIGTPVQTFNAAGRLIANARVTSVFPLTDPTTRTAVVEAIIPNPGHSLQPGDRVQMSIQFASQPDAITVPSAAIVNWNGGAYVWVAAPRTQGKPLYTCTMHPDVIEDKPGNCPKCGMKLVRKDQGGGYMAHKVQITTGATNGQRTAVLSGLTEGDCVIWAGQTYLKEGDPVDPVPWGQEGPLVTHGVKPAPGGSMPGMPGMSGSPAPPPAPSPQNAPPPEPSKSNGGSMPGMPGMRGALPSSGHGAGRGGGPNEALYAYVDRPRLEPIRPEPFATFSTKPEQAG